MSLLLSQCQVRPHLGASPIQPRLHTPQKQQVSVVGRSPGMSPPPSTRQPRPSIFGSSVDPRFATPELLHPHVVQYQGGIVRVASPTPQALGTSHKPSFEEHASGELIQSMRSSEHDSILGNSRFPQNSIARLRSTPVISFVPSSSTTFDKLSSSAIRIRSPSRPVELATERISQVSSGLAKTPSELTHHSQYANRPDSVQQPSMASPATSPSRAYFGTEQERNDSKERYDSLDSMMSDDSAYVGGSRLMSYVVEKGSESLAVNCQSEGYDSQYSASTTKPEETGRLPVWSARDTRPDWFSARSGLTEYSPSPEPSGSPITTARRPGIGKYNVRQNLSPTGQSHTLPGSFSARPGSPGPTIAAGSLGVPRPFGLPAKLGAFEGGSMRVAKARSQPQSGSSTAPVPQPTDFVQVTCQPSLGSQPPGGSIRVPRSPSRVMVPPHVPAVGQSLSYSHVDLTTLAEESNQLLRSEYPLRQGSWVRQPSLVAGSVAGETAVPLAPGGTRDFGNTAEAQVQKHEAALERMQSCNMDVRKPQMLTRWSSVPAQTLPQRGSLVQVLTRADAARGIEISGRQGSMPRIDPAAGANNNTVEILNPGFDLNSSLIKTLEDFPEKFDSSPFSHPRHDLRQQAESPSIASDHTHDPNPPSECLGTPRDPPQDSENGMTLAPFSYTTQQGKYDDETSAEIMVLSLKLEQALRQVAHLEASLEDEQTKSRELQQVFSGELVAQMDAHSRDAKALAEKVSKVSAEKERLTALVKGLGGVPDAEIIPSEIQPSSSSNLQLADPTSGCSSDRTVREGKIIETYNRSRVIDASLTPLPAMLQAGTTVAKGAVQEGPEVFSRTPSPLKGYTNVD